MRERFDSLRCQANRPGFRRACLPSLLLHSMYVIYLRRASLWEGRGATLGLPSMAAGYLSKGFYLCARAAFFPFDPVCTQGAQD